MIERKHISDLLLDVNNDRFAELYNGSEQEEDLIEYLLYTEAAEEVARNISEYGYYDDEVLWVTPRGQKFLVRDGNRRCAAVKALLYPKKYGFDSQKRIEELPVLIYSDEKELERRILEQHTHSLFKQWDPIAKALKAFQMHKSGSSEDAISEIDSNPSRLIKLASFYYEAVKIANGDLKKLLRRGRGKTGGKTIIFERLFPSSKNCGYRFKNKPSYEIEVFDEGQFKNYVKALVEFLSKNPNTTHMDIDADPTAFLNRLDELGFKIKSSFLEKGAGTIISAKPPRRNPNATPPVSKRGSVKSRPTMLRKKLAPKLKRLIQEFNDLDHNHFANAKMALARVTFETVLKFVVEETTFKGKKIASSNHLRPAFYDKRGAKKTYINFYVLKKKFSELISDKGTQRAFESFDLANLHDVVHNYKIGAVPSDARSTAENLLYLVEFMLQDEPDLLAALDTSKL